MVAISDIFLLATFYSSTGGSIMYILLGITLFAVTSRVYKCY